MARAKVKTSGSTRSVAADSAAVAALAGTLESLLAQSQASADRLTRLLAQAHGVQAGPAAAEVVPPRDDSRTDQLETARAVAEAADQAKSCFLAAMSRELRTPVDGLARMIELLQQTDIDDEQRRYLRTANQSVCALLSLLDSVLSMSKVDAAVIELRTTDFELRRIVDDVIALGGPVAGRKGLRLTGDVRPEVPSLLRGEPGRLRQILLYTIRRAIQFAAHGEIALSVAVESTGDCTTTIRFTIRHTDTEVSRDEFDRAFAPNSHLDGRRASSPGGRGLGLTIARHLVELMGGRIDIEKNNGRGFTVWFTIPLDNYRRLGDERRAHGRLQQELLQSSLGPVLNLSMGGMRVRSNKPAKGTIDVELLDLESPVTVRAEVMWTRRIGFRKYEVGLNFPHVPPDIAKQLTRVSLNHRLRRLLGL
ncbi:MAG: PilZ domain-containing protein [Planctomycetes bacterium]|nr:PilZ domain-containing protein [Planctomycetota bacterium]